MSDKDIQDLFDQVDDTLDSLKLAILEAESQGIESGTLTKSTKHVRGELRWPYPYGDRKLELSLEIKAGIPREEES